MKKTRFTEELNGCRERFHSRRATRRQNHPHKTAITYKDGHTVRFRSPDE